MPTALYSSLTEEEKFTIDCLRSRLKLFSGTRLLLVMKAVLAEIINEVPTIEHRGFFHQMICTAQHLLQENIDKDCNLSITGTKEYRTLKEREERLAQHNKDLTEKLLRLESEVLTKDQVIERLAIRNTSLSNMVAEVRRLLV